MFNVESVIAYMCICLHKLIDTGLFVPSSVNTRLGDDKFIARLGGDKGGKEVQFKFGFSIMNQALANSPQSFNIPS